jgi:hypothetical protein
VWLFADDAPEDVAAAVLGLLDDPGPLVAELSRAEATLNHGDLKYANLGLTADRVILLDWGTYTGMAPPAVDFAWFLLQNAARIDASREDLIADFRELSTTGSTSAPCSWPLAARPRRGPGARPGRAALVVPARAGRARPLVAHGALAPRQSPRLAGGPG